MGEANFYYFTCLNVKTFKMEGKATVDGLKNHFETIIRRTFLAYDLRNCNDPVDKETLRTIEQDVRYMERAVTELKKVLANGKLELEEMHARTRDVRALVETARHMSDNVPDCLPRVGAEELVGTARLSNDAAPEQQQQLRQSSRPEVAKENVAPPSVTGQPKAAPPNATNKQPSVPLIPPLTMDEYNETPKYMLGRITYASLNKTVQDINLTMAEKYRLMKKKQKDKTPQEIRQVQTFKKQENAESQGAHFILADDLKSLGVCTDGLNSRQFATHLPILRHHRRLREIRGGGYTRLALC